MDYDPAQKKCVCLRHPCWDDNGVQHKCPGDVPEAAWAWAVSLGARRLEGGVKPLNFPDLFGEVGLKGWRFEL